MKWIGIIGGLALATTTLMAAPASAHDRGNDSSWGRERRHDSAPILKLIFSLGDSSHSRNSYDRRYDRSDRGSYGRSSGWRTRRDSSYRDRDSYRDSSYRDSRYDSSRDDCN
jgi:hypothetical protein